MIIATTERLALREAVDEDAAFFLELLNSEGFIANIGDRGVRSEAEAMAYIAERVYGSYHAYGSSSHWKAARLWAWLGWSNVTGSMFPMLATRFFPERGGRASRRRRPQVCSPLLGRRWAFRD
jgi:hypothetical protein